MHNNMQSKIKLAADQVIYAKASVELIRQMGVNGKAERMLATVNVMLERALSALGEVRHG